MKIVPEKRYISEPAATRDSIHVLEGEVLNPEDDQARTQAIRCPRISISLR